MNVPKFNVLGRTLNSTTVIQCQKGEVLTVNGQKSSAIQVRWFRMDHLRIYHFGAAKGSSVDPFAPTILKPQVQSRASSFNFIWSIFKPDFSLQFEKDDKIQKEVWPVLKIVLTFINLQNSQGRREAFLSLF